MTVSRRTILRVVGVGAVSAVSASCTGSPGQGGLSSGVNTPASGPPDWVALRARLSGGLVLPGDSAYAMARRGFNSLFDGNSPAAVATCTKPEDVQACVEVAHGSRVPIAARSGGHSYAGYSSPNDGLVVDLGGMSRVDVRSDGTAEIQAGARLIDVYYELAAAGRSLPAGSCPTVGIAGLTLGGGIGVVDRKYGLTIDKLVSARVVTADARLHTASADSEPDLFWALRGGGGGNVGIVTSFTFATDPAPDITVFALPFPAGAAADVAGAWQEWITDIPDELWAAFAIGTGPPPSCGVGGSFIGSESALKPVLDKLIAATSAQPTSTTVQTKGYLDAMRHFAGCSERSRAQCHAESAGGQIGRDGFYATSRMLPKAVDAGKLVAAMAGKTGVNLQLDAFGGAISRVAPDATAFPHRTALASAQIYASTTTSTREQATATVTAVRDELGALTGPTGYVNYIDPTMPDWRTAYYGSNAARLADIAHKYDPDAVFRFAQGMSPG